MTNSPPLNQDFTANGEGSQSQGVITEDLSKREGVGGRVYSGGRAITKASPQTNVVNSHSRLQNGAPHRETWHRSMSSPQPARYFVNGQMIPPPQPYNGEFVQLPFAAAPSPHRMYSPTPYHSYDLPAYSQQRQTNRRPTDIGPAQTGTVSGNKSTTRFIRPALSPPIGIEALSFPSEPLVEKKDQTSTTVSINKHITPVTSHMGTTTASNSFSYIVELGNEIITITISYAVLYYYYYYILKHE